MENVNLSDSIKQLKNTLENTMPALLLGAGFSVGSKNHKEKTLPVTHELCDRLYMHFWGNDLTPDFPFIDDRQEAKKMANNDDLKKMCTLLRVEDRLEDRNEFLTETFKGAFVDENDSRMQMISYPWEYIFTLNIDDLVENIYRSRKKRLKVWNQLNGSVESRKACTTLVKLHGCVNNTECGYVFDDNEYINFLNEENYLLKEFGHQFVNGSIICIGTEFQEQDLLTMINKYKRSGFPSDAQKYFFITPEIHDFTMKKIIEKESGFYHIPWTGNQFFDFLSNKVLKDQQVIRRLKEKGFVAVSEYQESHTEYYESKLYTGVESVLDDFFDNWDIAYPGIINIEKFILSWKKSLMVAVIGSSYCGKTVIVKRILVDLKNNGYIACIFSLDSIEKVESFREYLSQLPKNSKIAVLFDNAAFYYDLISRELLKKPISNIKQLVILSSDNTNSQYVKRYSLFKGKEVAVFEVSEHISVERSRNIYNKLKEKHWLNKPSLSGYNQREFCEYASKKDDIIELLYIISSGAGFEKHYKERLGQDLEGNEVYYRCVYMLEIMGLLGLLTVPKLVLQRIASDVETFNFHIFLEKYGDLLVIEGGKIKLRCLRLLKSVMLKSYDHNEVIRIISKIARLSSGMFRDGEINIWNEVFYKVLSVKSLLDEKLLTMKEVSRLLNMLEKEGENYSYYWIQRGIISEKMRDFDLAENYFNEALKIRPQSYQANHAKAKNWMERSLYLLKIDDGMATHYMEEGKHAIREIMEDKKFSRGFKFSLHTYLDMLLKYHNKRNTLIEQDDVALAEGYILRIKEKEMDSTMSAICKRFFDYCHVNNIGSLDISRMRRYQQQLDQEHINSILDYDVEDMELLG